MIDPRARAACSSADPPAAVFPAHGLRFARHREGFQALDPPPFSSLVMLTAPCDPAGTADPIAGAVAWFGRRIAVKAAMGRLMRRALAFDR